MFTESVHNGRQLANSEDVRLSFHHMPASLILASYIYISFAIYYETNHKIT